jgi:hypothetical protein
MKRLILFILALIIANYELQAHEMATAGVDIWQSF